MEKMKEIHIWGIKFNPMTRKDFASEILLRLQKGERRIHVTGVNPEQIVKAQRNSFLQQAINESSLVNIDGFLAVLFLRLKGYEVPERVATPDVMNELLKHADRNRQSVYFLGAEPTVIEKAVVNIRQRFPNLVVAGYHGGFFKDDTEIVKEIESSEPDYLFIALPSPQKEMFILNNKKRLNVGVFYGVGGAFDILGEKCRRAPELFQRLNLEWVWRICQNPKQNGMRVWKFYPGFLKMLFRK